MKSYRIYVQNNGVYYFTKTKEGKLSDVVNYCKEHYGEFGGYIKDENDNKILRRF